MIGGHRIRGKHGIRYRQCSLIIARSAEQEAKRGQANTRKNGVVLKSQIARQPER